MSLGQASKALELRQQALAIRKAVGDRLGEAKSLNNLGVIYEYLGQRSKALEFHQQALALLNETAAATGTNSFPSANKSLFLDNIGLSYLDLTHQQRQHVSGTAKDVLIVGNPTMPSVPSKLGEKPEPLPQLPSAEREANAIANLFNTKALTGNRATKAFIVQQMTGARMIHLATHGLLDDFLGVGVPGAIALAPSSSDDGLLTASEILNLKLSAELVVLSACNTGRGRITSDGVIGLSRSLISAGVPSLIVSLWSVPDAPTTQLMTEFYRNLQPVLTKPKRYELPC